jgi:nucleoside-diphosphate-sugar epimerase
MRYKWLIERSGLLAERFVSEYRHSKVLVTGGLGFIGSNLALRLARAGARVTVVDSAVPGCGANHHNIAAAGGDVRVVIADIAGAASFAADIRGCSVIFNLAGEVSHIHSMRDPSRDAALNATAQLRFLEECARQAPGVRVVYASTRQIYGAPKYLPVDESHPVQPVDFNGIHKYAATAYHLLWSAMGRIDGRVLCLTNVYGPRMALHLTCQGFLGNFVRRALLRQPIEVFGDGRQLRDPMYVDDAVDAFLLAGASQAPHSRLWNVGGGGTLSLARIASIISSAVGIPGPVFRPFPEEQKGIDIGSYSSDSFLIRTELGWQPAVAFEPGIQKTLEYFQREFLHYLRAEDGEPECALQEVPVLGPAGPAA